MKLSMARVSVSSCRPQTSSRMDLRETVRPLLRIRWRSSFASIRVSWMVVPLTRSSSVPKSMVLPLKEKTSESTATFAPAALALTALSLPSAARPFAAFFSATIHWLRRSKPCSLEKNRQLKWLRQIVVCAGGKSLQHIFRAAARGQNQHRNVIVSLAQRCDDRETVFAGQHDDEHDCVEIFFFCNQALERGFAIAGNFHGVAFRFEVEAQSLGQVRFIFHDQHAAHATFLGNSSEMVEPRPSPSLAAYTFPPCARATVRTMKRPSPVPLT